MKSKVFENVELSALEPEVQAWERANPNVTVKKRHPVELTLQTRHRGKLTNSTYSIRVDYID
jgi:hypothetical protein